MAIGASAVLPGSAIAGSNSAAASTSPMVRRWSVCWCPTVFAAEVLRPGGCFVAKVLAGGADSSLVAALKRDFATIKHAKPPASRKESSEWYVVAQGFKGRAEADPSSSSS